MLNLNTATSKESLSLLLSDAPKNTSLNDKHKTISHHAIKRITLLLLCVSTPVLANTNTQNNIGQIYASPHELALLQVMHDICPLMLNKINQQKFNQAYLQQMHEFMPNLDIAATLTQINQHRDYQNILEGVRTWTLNFPKDENRQLCIEFAQSAP